MAYESSPPAAEPSAAVISMEYLRGLCHEPIVKEIALASLGNKHAHIQCMFYLPPYSRKYLTPDRVKENAWLTTKLNGFTWDMGEVDYKCLRQSFWKICKPYTDLYSKGSENCKFLSSKIGRKVHDLDKFGCPKLSEIKWKVKFEHSYMLIANRSDFDLHNKAKSCAVVKSVKYATWMSEQPQFAKYSSNPSPLPDHISTAAVSVAEEAAAEAAAALLAGEVHVTASQLVNMKI